MKTSLSRSIFAGLLSTVIVMNVADASANQQVVGKVNAALAAKNLTEVQGLLAAGPGNVDDVLKALLKKTQSVMATDPDFSNKMMSLAGQYAPQITPPTVPVICADLRRIVDALKPEQVGTPFYKTVLDTTEAFSKAPVVVAAGRPNECEQAWLRAGSFGEEALLAQTPGMRGPGLPPVTVRPGVPPTFPSPTDKPSAD